MLKNILNTISNNKKTIFYFIVFFIAFFSFFDLASANEAVTDARFNEMKQTASVIFDGATKFVTVFLSLITFLAVLFLSPEWYNGSIFGLNGYFKDIWILVSNFVYFIFAFILIWISFMNIIGKGQDKYALKQALPKFVVGILIVPISWWLVQFILSMVTLLSIAALNFPFDTFKNYNQSVREISIADNCTLNLNELKSSDPVKDENGNVMKYFNCDESGKTLGVYMDSKFFTDSIFGVIGSYTYGILDLEKISELTASDLTNIKTIGDLVIKIIFDFLFILIYSILMIALGLALFTRGIYLWIYIMISPVFGLMYFFGKSDGGGKFFDKFNVKEFLALAMVPVYTMLALSLGLLFLYIIGQGTTSGKNHESNFFRIQKLDGQEGTKLTIGDNSASISIVGSISNDDDNNFLTELSNGSLGIIGTLIMKIFGVVVLRIAVMAALTSSKTTEKLLEPLVAFGNQVGSLAVKSPQYAPIFGGQSMQSMNNIGTQAQGFMNTRATEKSNKFIKDHGLFGSDSYVQGMQTNIIKAQSATDGTGIKDSVQEAFRLMNGNETRLNQKEFKDLLDAISQNRSSDIPQGFKDYMSGKSGQTLNTQEIVEALNLLENERINFDFNRETIGSIVPGNLIQHIQSLKGSEQSTSTTSGTTQTQNQAQTINLNITNSLTNATSPTLQIGNEVIHFTKSGNEINEVGTFTDSTLKNIARAVLSDNGVRDQYDNFSANLKNKINKFIKDGEIVDNGGNGSLDKPASS